MKAWLIYSESFLRGGTGADTRIDRVVSILRPDMADHAVRSFLLQCYMDTMGENIQVRLDYAKRGHGRRYEFYVTRAKFGYRIGHDPWLWARHVSDLRVASREPGKTWLAWKDNVGKKCGPVYESDWSA